MGKAGRFACILTPMLCTLASLVCTILVLVGGTNKSSSLATNLYFFSVRIPPQLQSPLILTKPIDRHPQPNPQRERQSPHLPL